MTTNNKKSTDNLSGEAKAFLMDAAMYERMKQREAKLKNRTPEQIKQDKLDEEKAADIDKIVFGEMTKEEFKKKWNIE